MAGHSCKKEKVLGRESSRKKEKETLPDTGKKKGIRNRGWQSKIPIW